MPVATAYKYERDRKARLAAAAGGGVVSPALQPVVSVAAVLLLMWLSLTLRDWRRRALKRRNTPQAPETLLEKRIAVGSLAGVAPADIRAHVVITLDGDGGLKITGAGCPALLLFMMATAAGAGAAEAYQAHDCRHGGTE